MVDSRSPPLRRKQSLALLKKISKSGTVSWAEHSSTTGLPGIYEHLHRDDSPAIIWDDGVSDWRDHGIAVRRDKRCFVTLSPVGPSATHWPMIIGKPVVEDEQ